jgi:hypothetical protein
MSPEEIVSFFIGRGLHVVRTASCWWYEEQRHSGLYYSFPTHGVIDPQAAECSELFDLAPSALAFRFIAPLESRGHPSFIWVRRPDYDLNALSSKSRNQTRRGMESCEVRKIPWDELVSVAGAANADTMKRHGQNGSQSLGFDTELAKCPAYEAWGAFADGELAAYVVTLTVENRAHILVQRSVTAHLKLRPNNALVFLVVKELLSRPGVASVGYGLEPLDVLDSLDHFKSGMGFVKEPVCQRILIAPRLKLLLNPITARPIEVFAALLPKMARLQKVAGICRLARKS